MRVAIDSTGAGVSAWIDALRREARGEEIVEFTPPAAARLFGSKGLDFALRGADLLHASPATPAAPTRAKLTATIEDLSCWLLPDLHTPARMKAAALFAERILARADGLIAVSETARKDAIRLLSIDPGKIATIYPGVDPAFFEARAAQRTSLRPYILCTGDPDPRANFATLQQAWQQLKPDLRSVYDLVTLDTIPAPELPEWMASATLLVHVPLYETFPLPVAQAMAAGIAVVMSETSGVPEIGRDAGLMVDPHSPSAIAGALTRLLESDSERAKLARYGRARAELYRWRRCASESLAFFHRVAGK